MPARYRLTILLFIDALLLCAAGATAIVLRFLESGNLLLHLQIYLPDVLLGVIFYLASFYAFRLYHRVWAYASTGELLAIAGAATCGTAAHMAGAYL
ncbi:MAG: polysaccharide biosynthesis protein, partial [Bacillota bacterium]